jgi:predicted TIM-barrel fold metal-dependent hydrolase
MSVALKREPRVIPEVAYPIYDCDHHYYEPPEAFLRHLPPNFRNDFQYVQVNGRTKLAVDGVLSDYIPNPTFEVVARPGSHEDWFRGNNPEGRTLREMTGEPLRSQPSFHNGAAHLKLMDEQNVHAALIFPTLASVIEVRLGHKPELINALFHSLNLWVAEEYGFTNGRQFPVAAICLTDVDYAVRELESVIKLGCKAVLIRPAPVPGRLGGRSPASPEFDPFWARVAEAKMLVTNHVSDSGYDQISRWWTEGATKEFRPFEKNSFKSIVDSMGRAAADTYAAFICHGLLDRFPSLRFASVENSSHWVPTLLERMRHVYRQAPHDFKRDPVQAFREQVYVMPAYEDSIVDLTKLIGADHVLFGSDWPHPEGLERPLDFFGDIKDLSPAEQRQIMSTNLKDLLDV